MSADSGSVGWAFLVARTRTRGYRLMLAPADRAAIRTDLIERCARPDVNGGPTIQIVRDGQAVLSLVFDTHRLTGADLAAASVRTEPADLILDEHGRPIDVVYGFVCAAAVQEAADSDLATARAQALDAYRRALTGGQAPPSEPYRLESSLRAVPPGGIDARPMPLPPASLRSAVATQPRSTGSKRIWMIVAGAVTVLIGAIGGCVTLRPSIAPVPDRLAGTWRGELQPTEVGSPNARTITVTIACEDACNDRGRPIGNAHDSYNCQYELAAKSIADQTLTASMTGTGPTAGCLPPGTVGISPAGQPDVVTIDWTSTSSGEVKHMKATCTRQR
jgi:hypothetical protein